jgi:hypothetical protein
MRIRTVAVLANVLGTCVLAACGDDGGPVAPSDVAGEYALQTVNESPLPFEVQQPPGAEILAGGVSLRSGSRYDLLLDYRDKVGSSSYEESGTWGMFAGDSIVFRPEGSVPLYRGRVAGGVLTTLTPDGLSLRFGR